VGWTRPRTGTTAECPHGVVALAVAAIHAGTVKLAETAAVKVTVVEPFSPYCGSARNGISRYPDHCR
jgi:hypothetical protein